MMVLPNVKATANSVVVWTLYIMTSKNYSPAHNCLKLLSLAAYDSASRFSQEQIRTQSILCKEFI